MLAAANALIATDVSTANVSAPILHARGLLAAIEGLHAVAIACLTCAIQLDPTTADYRHDLSAVARGPLLDAARSFETAVDLEPDFIEAHERLGRAWLTRGEWSLALAAFRSGLQSEPDCLELLLGVGEALRHLGRLDDAVRVLRAGLRIEPGTAPLCIQLGEILDQLGRPAEAAHAWRSLGDAMLVAGRYSEAEQAYAAASSREPLSLRGRQALGRVNIALGMPMVAISPLVSVVERDPQNVSAHIDLGTAYHLVGDIDRGWDEFAHYHHPLAEGLESIEQPLWDGSPLAGRTVLLWAEMGRGDVIQFLRYVRFAKTVGAGTVIVRCNHSGLAPLVARIPSVDRVVVPGQPMPAFDVHAPLTFFPALFLGCRDESFDRVPYLTIDHHLVETWRQRLGPSSHLTVGLSWAGNTDTISAGSRFVSLSAFTALKDVPGVRLISLQHGPQTGELLVPVPGLRIERVLADSSSIADAAALLLNLDAVITVDTMIAHLAGALGKDVWVLLRYATNWRWRSSGETTRWYPTMRLFRQTRLDDWSDVFAKVRAALVAAVSHRTAEAGTGVHHR